MNYITLTHSDIANGLGIRSVIWISGCTHNCPDCHNPESHCFMAGLEFKTDDILEQLEDEMNKPYTSGITLSGGDPLDRSNKELGILLDFLTKFKEKWPEKNIWLYTGFEIKWADEKRTDNFGKILGLCDVIVDGPYMKDKRSLQLAFRGSSNQRILEHDKKYGFLYNRAKEYDEGLVSNF
jgi:anaerobic ribonucleoside-triphosphate reductase activating protein